MKRDRWGNEFSLNPFSKDKYKGRRHCIPNIKTWSRLFWNDKRKKEADESIYRLRQTF
jgi:hypothetical protein